jgi:hypothetical protein
MSMTTHVRAFKPPGEKWQQMKAVWDACKAVGIDPPREVGRYFEDTDPDPTGVVIDENTLVDLGVLRGWSDQYREGREIDVTKLPKDVTVIRFYNSW